MDTFDLRETVIPFSLLVINNRFRRMASGEVFEILTSDRSVEKDIKRILPSREFELLGIEEAGGREAGFKIRLRKIFPAD